MMWALAAPWVLFCALVTLRYHRRRPHLRDYAPQYAGGAVSVVVPARNEAVNIERCIRSILAARYEPLDVIVVDDRSTDDTAEIVERLTRSPEGRGRVRLVAGAELPAGWFGKQWALVQGYRETRGDLLLFADADTHHEPDLIARAVGALTVERVDLVSVVPRQEMGTFWERLVQPHVFLALQARVGDLRRVNRTRTEWDAFANGQFILTTRTAYEAVGTHEAVKTFVAEDVTLAQAYVRHGKDIFLAHAPDFMSTRMYRSLREIIDGWSKNLALGAPLVAPPIRLVRRLLPYLMWLPALASAHYLLRHYEEAIEIGRRAWALNPNWPTGLRYAVAGLGQLGRIDEAQAALPELKTLDTSLANVEGNLTRLYYSSRACVDHFLDGLRKAGFE